MPRKVNHSKRPEYVALEIMTVGKAVTPSEIDSHVGVGKYSSKYVSFLKRDGYVINVTKDGRNVVSYTLVSKPTIEPAAAQGRPAAAKKLAKAAKVKAAKAGAPSKKTKTAKVATPVKSKTGMQPMKTKNEKNDDGFVLPEKKMVQHTSIKDPHDDPFSVDQEFDSMEGFDPRDYA